MPIHTSPFAVVSASDSDPSAMWGGWPFIGSMRHRLIKSAVSLGWLSGKMVNNFLQYITSILITLLLFIIICIDLSSAIDCKLCGA